MLRTRALTSRKLGSVSGDAEALYYRLMLLADDFGRYFADHRIVQSHAYPLGEREVAESFEELVTAGLIHVYEDRGEPYLEFDVWDQTVRAKESRFPDPPTDVRTRAQMPTDAPLDVDGVVDVVEDGDVVKGAHAPRNPDDNQRYLLESLHGSDEAWKVVTFGALQKLNTRYGRPVVNTALGNLWQEKPPVNGSAYGLLEAACKAIEAKS